MMVFSPLAVCRYISLCGSVGGTKESHAHNRQETKIEHSNAIKKHFQQRTESIFQYHTVSIIILVDLDIYPHCIYNYTC